MPEKKYRVLIGLDRDGTINHDPGHLGRDDNWKEQVRILPGAIEGIVALKQLPRSKLVVCSNQVGVARKFFDSDRVVEINKYINNILAERGADIDDWYFCPYIDESYAFQKGIPKNSPWVANTDLIKPGIGMLEKAAEDIEMKLNDFDVIVFAGDRASDVEAGLNARGYGVFLANADNSEERAKVAKLEKSKAYEGKVFVSRDLQDAANIIRLITRLNGLLR